MTVSSTSSRAICLGNGSNTSFPFAFKVNQPADLAVVYTDATGVDYTLSPSQYSATGFGVDAGGTVTYPLSGSPIATGTRLTIYRDVAATQPTSISNQGAMWPQVIEAALDRLTFIAQKVTDTVSRSLVVSPTDSVSLTALPNATLRANSVLAFDSQGQPYAGTLTGSLVSVATWVAQYLLPASTPLGGCNALGAAYLPGSNSYTGTNDFTAGRAQVPTRAAGDNGLDAASTAFVKAKAESTVGGVVLRSYLAGLRLSNDGGTPNTRLDVAAGVCTDSTNAQMLAYAGGTPLDCTGVGVNGLDTGVLASSTWYHVFVIGKVDGTTGLLASLSASSPAMPSGYTLNRRIGAFRTDGSTHILAFTQTGDEFRWAASVADVNATNPGTSAVTPVLSVPTGVRVAAFGTVVIQIGSTGTTLLLSDPAANNEAPLATTGTPAPPGITLAAVTATCNVGAPFAVRTDTSARIRYRLSASASDIKVGIFTQGWIDRRGRDD